MVDWTCVLQRTYDVSPWHLGNGYKRSEGNLAGVGSWKAKRVNLAFDTSIEPDLAGESQQREAFQAGWGAHTKFLCDPRPPSSQDPHLRCDALDTETVRLVDTTYGSVPRKIFRRKRWKGRRWDMKAQNKGWWGWETADTWSGRYGASGAWKLEDDAAQGRGRVQMAMQDEHCDCELRLPISRASWLGVGFAMRCRSLCLWTRDR